MTPWGTYLSGEENFAYYFDGPDKPDADQSRWGMRKTAAYPWASTTSDSTPSATRTSSTASAGSSRSIRWTRRARRSSAPRSAARAHEGAWVAVTQDGRAVVYSGEDARFEYIYKFVSRDPIAAGRRARPIANCSTTARCTSRASTPTAPAPGCRWSTARGR